MTNGSVAKGEGTDVFSSGSGLVRDEWLSGCKEERALTQDLMSDITDLKNLDAALRQVISNRGSAGIDGMTVDELRDWLNSHHRELQRQLMTGTYQVTAVKEVLIPKPDGGKRQLGIPTVKDRLVQQAISQVLSKRYDPIFSEYSYGFRPRRNAHQALRKAGEYVAEGKDWVIDIDLAKFFDEVNHDRLLWQLSTRVGDKRVLKLIGKFLRAGMLIGDGQSTGERDTARQPTITLLSNIVLDELDKELERRGHCFVRYADDIIIMVGSEPAAERSMQSLSKFIENRMRLRINKEKEPYRPSSSTQLSRPYYLKRREFRIKPKERTTLQGETKIAYQTQQGISFDQLISELNPVLRGWLNYFKHAKMKSRLRNLEAWLRRRLRCYRLKQCKRALGIARFLTKLGVPWNRSWTTAGSSKGWFRLSMTHAAHEGMNLEWFKKTGLYSLTANYG